MYRDGIGGFGEWGAVIDELGASGVCGAFTVKGCRHLLH
jgi:hypothetical protein